MILNNSARVGEDKEPKKDADAREKQPVNRSGKICRLVFSIFIIKFFCLYFSFFLP